MTWIRIGRLVLLGSILGAALATGASPARAVSISPRLLEAAKTPAQAAALRARQVRYEQMRSKGVDKVFPQFSLDMSKYARGGVAHRNILVVLAQFPGEAGNPAWGPSSKSTPFYYNRVFFSNDPNDGIQSLREYYENNSHGRLIISGSVTSQWLMMPHSYAYYANGSSGLDFFNYPRSSQRLAEDAMAAAYSDFGGKLGAFDNDGPDGVASSGDDDGYIDAVVVIHAGRGAEIIPGGPGSEDPDWALWSHEAGITQFTGCTGLNSTDNCVPGFQLGNVKGFIYLVVGEYNDYPGDFSVGTYCHEFGHTLGLMDLYDPQAAGLGFFSLMALGNYLPYEVGKVLGSHPGSLDAWSRQYLGFDSPDVVTTPGQYKLAPVTEGGGSLKIWSNGEPGTEYFLVEHRKKVGPDRDLPGDGLIVYHVDDTKQDNLGGAGNYRVSVVQADSLNPLQLESPTGNFGDDADPFPGSLGKRSLTNDTQPNTRSLAGSNTGIRIWNIFAGSVDNADTATFDVAISTRPEIRITHVTTSDGGGDGYPDPTESVDISLQLKNVGLASNSIALTLSTVDPSVTVTTAGSTALALAGDAIGSTQTPFVVSIGSPATLPHDVLMNMHWNDGSASGDEKFLITIGMGSGLTENFELGTTGWSHVAVDPLTSTADDWHLTSVRAHGGTGSMKLGSTLALGTGTNENQTYAPDQDAALISPAFDLPANSELVFWSYVDAETNGGTGAWDGGRVEISLAGGEWLPLDVDGGYDHMIEFNSSAGLRGALAFSGSPKSWRRVVADLSAYTGPTRIRFRFATDAANDPRDQNGAQLRPYEGWYVDDIAVQARSSSGPTPRHISFRAGPTPYRLDGPSSGSLQFRFSAPDGLPKPGQTPEVKIYDVRGREVGHTFAAANPLAPAEFRAAWQPKSEGGANLGSGIYFARVDFMGKAQTVRLVLVR